MTARMKQLLSFEENDPNDPFIQFAIAKEHEKSNELEAALERYNTLRISHPDYIGLYYHLAKLYETLQRKHKAIFIYEEGLKLAKSTSDFHAASELNNAKMNLELEIDD